jgi:hypothetical protein
MNAADAGVKVEIVFSDVARHAFDAGRPPTAQALPAGFLARAHSMVAGDLVRLSGSEGLFIVSHRIWTLKAGKTTLKLVLDVLVHDEG